MGSYKTLLDQYVDSGLGVVDVAVGEQARAHGVAGEKGRVHDRELLGRGRRLAVVEDVERRLEDGDPEVPAVPIRGQGDGGGIARAVGEVPDQHRPGCPEVRPSPAAAARRGRGIITMRFAR